jgi:hypothetical protein
LSTSLFSFRAQIGQLLSKAARHGAELAILPCCLIVSLDNFR